MGDEEFYQAALKEFESGSADKGLLAKAWVNANGEESRQKIEYVKLRVSQMKAARIKRTATAVGAAAMTVAPSIFGFTIFLAKSAALVLIFAFCVTALSEIQGETNPGNTAGSVLAGVAVIYLISKLLEWVLIKRIVKNRDAMILSSTALSFALITALWYSGKDNLYAAHPSFLLNFLLASLLLALARTFLPRNTKRRSG